MQRLSAALKRTTIFAIVCLFSCSMALATTVRMPSDEELIVGARAIVRGTVLSVASAFDNEGSDAGGRIYTYTVVRVREVLKGEISDRRLVIKEAGGQVGSRGSRIWGTPEFLPGEEVLLYLTTRADGSLRVHEMFLGKFNIVTDPVTGRRAVTRSPAGENVSIVGTQSSVHAVGGEATDRRDLGEYLSMVRRTVRDTRARFAEFERQHFDNLALRPQPAEYAALLSRDTLEPQFTFIRSTQPCRWFEPDDELPVMFTINPDGAPNPQVVDDIVAAMNAWSTVAGSSLRVASGGTTTECNPHGTGNTMVFNNCDGYFSPTPDCSSVIAIGGVNWDVGETRVINGVTFAQIYQGHVSFNPYSACSYERHCEVQEIATHELGHALGLGHSQDGAATMAGSAHFDGRCASLKQDDIYAIKFIYPATAAGGTFLHVATESLPNAYLVTNFEHQLAAAGGVAPFRWSLVAGGGALPAGFQFLPSGLLRGSPFETGSWTFAVKVTDAVGVTAQKTLTLNALQTQPAFDSWFMSQSTPTTVRAGQEFQANIKWKNIGAHGWNGSTGASLVSQNPANNSTWGGDVVALFGYNVAPNQHLDITFTARAPQVNGIYNFQWRLQQDGTGAFGQASANVQITVTGGTNPISINSPDSFQITAGSSFSHQFTVAGGAAPYIWAIQSGALPAGLALNTTTGTLSGTPSATGGFSFVIQATDAQSRAAQKSITINVVAAPPPPPLQFDITTATLPAGVLGASYNAQLAATGGAAPYSWATISGVLPAGLSLNTSTGALTGTPTRAGIYSFTARATDAQSRITDKGFVVTVAPPPISITTASLPAIAVRANYGAQLAATGGTPPYTWSVQSGTLPAGLSLNAATGVISGTPTAVGNLTFTVGVSDAAGASASYQFTINVLPAPLAVEQSSAQLDGTKGVAFAYQVNAAGGTAPYTWSIQSGTMPTGLALNSTSGLISGTPSVGGTFSVTITVRDQMGDTASAALQIKVIDPATIPRVTGAKYKTGKRLLQVFGERFAPDAILTIDGARVDVKFNEGVLVIKKLSLAPGNHQIIVLNSQGVASQPFVLTVQ